MTEYEKILADFRHHYYKKYGVQLDDEILYFFIRINEFQQDLKKTINEIPQIQFKTGWDYFLYGLGKWTGPSVAISVFGFILYLILLKH